MIWCNSNNMTSNILKKNLGVPMFDKYSKGFVGYNQNMLTRDDFKKVLN